MASAVDTPRSPGGCTLVVLDRRLQTSGNSRYSNIASVLSSMARNEGVSPAEVFVFRYETVSYGKDLIHSVFRTDPPIEKLNA